MRTNPFLRELMETFLKVGGRRGKAGGPGIDFDELGVSEVVELLDDANMEAVVRDFGDRNPQEDPVIHFYELFLKEYDARSARCSAASSTPRARSSPTSSARRRAAATEFGLADGLADTTTWGEMAEAPRRTLNDPREASSPGRALRPDPRPATGTGTFLVEVIDVIHKHARRPSGRQQGHGEQKIATLWNDYVPKHLLPRLHGYELMMAPYAIAHLKIGLKLYETGYRFGSDERARIYLTNALEPCAEAARRSRASIRRSPTKRSRERDQTAQALHRRHRQPAVFGHLGEHEPMDSELDRGLQSLTDELRARSESRELALKTTT